MVRKFELTFVCYFSKIGGFVLFCFEKLDAFTDVKEMEIFENVTMQNYMKKIELHCDFVDLLRMQFSRQDLLKTAKYLCTICYKSVVCGDINLNGNIHFLDHFLAQYSFLRGLFPN